MTDEQIGLLIQQARMKYGITQQELAVYCNKDCGAMSHYECGKRRIPATVLIDAAKMFRMTVDELLRGRRRGRK